MAKKSDKDLLTDVPVIDGKDIEFKNFGFKVNDANGFVNMVRGYKIPVLLHWKRGKDEILGFFTQGQLFYINTGRIVNFADFIEYFGSGLRTQDEIDFWRDADATKKGWRDLDQVTDFINKVPTAIYKYMQAHNPKLLGPILDAAMPDMMRPSTVRDFLQEDKKLNFDLDKESLLTRYVKEFPANLPQNDVTFPTAEDLKGHEAECWMCTYIAKTSGWDMKEFWDFVRGHKETYVRMNLFRAALYTATLKPADAKSDFIKDWPSFEDLDSFWKKTNRYFEVPAFDPDLPGVRKR